MVDMLYSLEGSRLCCGNELNLRSSRFGNWEMKYIISSWGPGGIRIPGTAFAAPGVRSTVRRREGKGLG